MTRHDRILSAGACALALGMLALGMPRLDAQGADVQQAVDSAYAKFKTLQEPVIVAGAAIIGLIAYPLLRG